MDTQFPAEISDLGRIDLVMWTRNGGSDLRRVLGLINAAIPESRVCHKIIVDARSTDATRSIGTDSGWDVVQADRVGIPYQANQALKMVDTDFFASFEQDILLNPQWLERMSKLMKGEKTAVVQGVRLFKGSRVLEAQDYCKFLWKRLPRWNYSIDNNLYRADIIRKIGGFPTLCPFSVDGVLRENLILSGYDWKIDMRTVSGHFHPSFWATMRAIIRRRAFQKVYYENYVFKQPHRNVLTFAGSLISGTKVARASHVPGALLAVPIQRYCKAVADVSRKLLRKKTVLGKIPLDVEDTGS